jgi:hypothetical protein
MSYLSAWRSISARISGLSAAATTFAALGGDASYGTGKSLRAQCGRLAEVIEAYGTAHAGSIPADALSCLTEAVTVVRTHTAERDPSAELVQSALVRSLVALTSFEAEMSYLLADVQADVRSRSERAFEHLQRSIVADASFRDRWAAAFKEGETACEKLGGAQLLLHGIWAFKANAEGGRTDLVYQNPIQDTDASRRWADGLVLTEWKVAKPDSAAEAMFEGARRQAGLYAKGILAGFELASVRYAVVVSERRVAPPPDLVIDGVAYRHVNIAVDPLTPSKDRVA